MWDKGEVMPPFQKRDGGNPWFATVLNDDTLLVLPPSEWHITSHQTALYQAPGVTCAAASRIEMLITRRNTYIHAVSLVLICNNIVPYLRRCFAYIFSDASYGGLYCTRGGGSWPCQQ